MATKAAIPLLAVADLFGGYEEFDVLRGAELEVFPAETVAIIGPNGAGKSTLLRAIFGAIATRKGAVSFRGDDVTYLHPRERMRRGMSFVPQGRVNFPAMTVDDNLEMAGYLAPPAHVRKRKEALMDRFPILGRRRRQLAGTMSGGEQQQLEMAMGLMLDPTLILIDEPSLGLDPKNVDFVFDAIEMLKREGIALVIVEQNATRALGASARAYVLEQGQTRMTGSAQAILEDPEVKRLYLGGRGR